MMNCKTKTFGGLVKMIFRLEHHSQSLPTEQARNFVLFALCIYWCQGVKSALGQSVIMLPMYSGSYNYIE